MLIPQLWRILFALVGLLDKQKNLISIGYRYYQWQRHQPYLGWAFLRLLTDRGLKGSPIPKICHIYPAMMKLGTDIPYINEIQKYINHTANPLISADISIFFTRNQQPLLYQERQIQIAFKDIISKSLNFFRVF